MKVIYERKLAFGIEAISNEVNNGYLDVIAPKSSVKYYGKM